jgi:hypothetical protein
MQGEWQTIIAVPNFIIIKTMGIHTSSKLFVGAARSDIKCDSDILNNAIPEGMTEEEADELPYIDRISPYYDADSQDCYYGITVSCDEIMNPGGVEMVQQLIAELNALFKTTKCKLMHSSHVA